MSNRYSSYDDINSGFADGGAIQGGGGGSNRGSRRMAYSMSDALNPDDTREGYHREYSSYAATGGRRSGHAAFNAGYSEALPCHR